METVKRTNRPRTVDGVSLDKNGDWGGSGLYTMIVVEDVKLLRKVLGAPPFNRSHCGDGKVSAAWFFKLPGGPASIWVHRWNKANELSCDVPLADAVKIAAFITARGCQATAELPSYLKEKFLTNT